MAWATVVTDCTEMALRTAMAGGGGVTFACDGTIPLASTITNESDTTRDGSGHQVTISGNGAVRVFYINTNVTFAAVRLTIAEGTSLGGRHPEPWRHREPDRRRFRRNTATLVTTNDALIPKVGGGAIFNRGGIVDATNCSFAETGSDPGARTELRAVGVRRAIRNEAGQVDLRCGLCGGIRSPGGIVGGLDPGVGDPGLGGAIHNSGTVTLDLCTLAGNSATGGAGGGLCQLTIRKVSGQRRFRRGDLKPGHVDGDRPSLWQFRKGWEWGCGRTPRRASQVIWTASLEVTGGGAYGGGICNPGSLRVTRTRLPATSSAVEPVGGPGCPADLRVLVGTGPHGGNGGWASVGRCLIAGRRAW